MSLSKIDCIKSLFPSNTGKNFQILLVGLLWPKALCIGITLREEINSCSTSHYSWSMKYYSTSQNPDPCEHTAKSDGYPKLRIRTRWLFRITHPSRWLFRTTHTSSMTIQTNPITKDPSWVVYCPDQNNNRNLVWAPSPRWSHGGAGVLGQCTEY